MDPEVTVITPAYDSMPYVTETVESVMRQSIGPDRIEYIVVDDGSTDGTAEEVDRLAGVWPSLKVMHLDSPSGTPARPRNRGLDIASGRYVFFLDADDYLGPEALERLVAVADAQSTDVVLGKTVGVDGRRPPKSMFKRSLPRTDVFDSRAYWTLSASKLFRRELIERLELRFPEDQSFGEDQPFTATAYLEAAGVSIVADYDCLFIRYREDASNMMIVTPLEPRLRCLGSMISLVTDRLGPGAQRDHLLHRHFEMAMKDVVALAVCEPDAALKERALGSVKRWTEEYFTDEIEKRLMPVNRIVFDLVCRGRLDAIPDVLGSEDEEEPRELVVEDGRVFDPLPYFRDEDVGVPDRRYDVTWRVKTFRHLSEAHWDGGVLRLAGCAHRVGLDTSRVRFAITLRERETGVEHVLPAETVEVPESALQACLEQPGGSAGFSAEIDVTTAASGEPLPEGTWDVRLRVDAQGAVRDIRLGSEKSPAVDTQERTRLVPSGDGLVSVVTSYYTKWYGNLSLDVGERWRTVDIAARQARWAADAPGTLIVTGAVNTLNVPPGSVVIRLEDTLGKVHEVAASLLEDAPATEFEARLRLKTAAEGRPLADGDWSVTAHLDAGDLVRNADVPDEEGLDAIRWWRGLRPVHAKSLTQDGSALRLRIVAVGLRRAARRRVRRLLGLALRDRG